MPTARHAVARVVERHLEEILDRSMQAFSAELESVRKADEDVLVRTRAAVRRVVLSFLLIYAEPRASSRILVDESRRATVERAGEMFPREEILTMLRIARQVVFSSTREFASAELTEDDAVDIDEALEGFLDELERDERTIEPADHAVRDLLASVEDQEPDLG